MIRPIKSQGLLRRGVAAAKAGDKAGARSLLYGAAQADPHSELTWLWLASVSSEADEAIEHLERALTINPFNQRARAWLVKIREKQGGVAVRLRVVARRHGAARAVGSKQAANEIRGRPTAWQCPMCLQWSLVKPLRCVRCRAVQSLADVWACFQDIEIDTGLLESAVARLLESRMADRVKRHETLGLTLLNLRRHQEALIHLSAAAALAPGKTCLGKTAYELMRRLSCDVPTRVATTRVTSTGDVPARVASSRDVSSRDVLPRRLI